MDHSQDFTADELGAETIRSFCVRFNISEAHYFAEARRGNMPATIRVGRRTLIPRAAIRAWLEQKVAEAQRSDEAAVAAA